MTISKEKVLKTAELVKIPLKENEVEKLSKMLSETLKYIEILNELNTSNVEETYQVNGQTNSFQKYEKQTLSQKEATKNAKNVVRGLIATKGVFDRD